MTSIAQTIEALIEQPLQHAGYELADCQYKKEGHQWYLRVFIDKPDGILIEDCVEASRLLEAILDEQDPIKQEYTLEVSSPGIFRPLKKLEHYQRFIGSRIKVQLFEPINQRKKFIGVLKQAQPDHIIIQTDQEDLEIPLSVVTKANLEPELKFK